MGVALGDWAPGEGGLSLLLRCVSLYAEPQVWAQVWLYAPHLSGRESKAAWTLCSSEGCAVPIAGNGEVRSM